MFFLIGLFLGMLYGAATQLALGIPLLFLRGFGLLWGDRRLWWSIALVVAIFVARYFVSASNRHQEVTDQLHRGFLAYQFTGVAIGAVFVWVIGMLILWKVGATWRAPFTGFAPVLSVVTLVALSASALILQKRPEAMREVRADNQAAWAEAIQSGDLAKVHEMNDSGKAIWAHSPGLSSGPIVEAVNRHEAGFVLELIAMHPRTSDARLSAVLAAAKSDRREMLKSLFAEAGEEKPALVSSALWWTIGNGDREFYDWLFTEFEPDPNQLPLKGSSLLMAAARTGRIDLARDLLDRGADLERLQKGGRHVGENALGNAIHFGQFEMFQFLLERGADPNGGTEGSYTLLMRAIDQKEPEMVPLLLEAGADPNVADREGFTALHVAARGSRPDLESAKLLIEAGADPNRANDRGFQPITRLPEEWFE
ncbi:MAG: ankyrin repeat domain-containing protein [Verrucomicrobiota bacterium]